MKPQSGRMIYWRDKDKLAWYFGYVTHTSNYNLIRLGRYNGDNTGDVLRDINDIIWEKYS